MADSSPIRFRPPPPARDRSGPDASTGLPGALDAVRDSRSSSRFQVEGITCGNCVQKVTTAARSVPGVEFAQADVSSRILQVTWSSDAEPAIEEVALRVSRAGYPARLVKPAASPAIGAHPAPARSPWRGPMGVAAACTLPLMAGEWVGGWHHLGWFQWLGFVLASVAMAFSGRQFALGAWRQGLSGSFGMDALVTLGAGTAYLLSTVALWFGWPTHLYFMEATAILAFISAGHWLETRVGQRAESTLRSLLQLTPQKAGRRNRDGSFSSVAVEELVPGDIIRLQPGDRIPTDGEIQLGTSLVDEAMLTGESVPVRKSAGSRVYAGTLNKDGSLEQRVTGVGGQTVLANIIRVVQRAQSSRASIQRLADKVSGVFVPCVILFALLTFLAWTFLPEPLRGLQESVAPWLWKVSLSGRSWVDGLIHAAAVLIVACPCAMGLATPAALMAAANAAAAQGILVRDAVALEKAGRISTVIFDKTGTLTEGILPVLGRWTDSDDRTGFPPSAIPQLVRELTRHSSHPVSRALALLPGDQAEDGLSMLTDWREHGGSGVSALVDRSPVQERARLGSLEWLSSAGVDLAGAQGFLRDVQTSGGTLVGVAVGARLLACYHLGGSFRPEVPEVLSDLRRSGYGILVLTGDSAEAARHAGIKLGLRPEDLIPSMSPQGKAEFIANLQKAGQRVAFVGDGLNDGPALAQSDLGIAVSKATDVARESADVVIIRGDLRSVPHCLNLAGRTLRIIHQNLFWAFFYNILAVPVAALGFISPMVCAIAMGLSDLIVVGNSLRLLRKPSVAEG